jgi:hypothetical protein
MNLLHFALSLFTSASFFLLFLILPVFLPPSFSFAILYFFLCCFPFLFFFLRSLTTWDSQGQKTEIGEGVEDKSGPAIVGGEWS